jgi:hypothetical protein
VTVAALYVEKGGAYWNLPGVDPWDENATRADTPDRIPSSRIRRATSGRRSPTSTRLGSPATASATTAAASSRRCPTSTGGAASSSIPRTRSRGAVQPHKARPWPMARNRRRLGNRGRSGPLWPSGPEADVAVRVGAWRRRSADAAGSRLGAGDVRRDRVGLHASGAKGEHVACEHRRVRPREASRTPDAFRDVLLELARSARLQAAA